MENEQNKHGKTISKTLRDLADWHEKYDAFYKSWKEKNADVTTEDDGDEGSNPGGPPPPPPFHP